MFGSLLRFGQRCTECGFNVTVLLQPSFEKRPNADAQGNTVCISMTLYADQSERLKYRSLPVDHG